MMLCVIRNFTCDAPHMYMTFETDLTGHDRCRTYMSVGSDCKLHKASEYSAPHHMSPHMLLQYISYSWVYRSHAIHKIVTKLVVHANAYNILA